ncbi:MAG: carbohydrate ABC transporter permease [Clostridiales bacterium]|jgi:multiple sugar transport system permease protein|nr:carbohydrate ABC transporter permease [Clostridiales bacterium]HOB37119.1 carbohydrate ABC transporter permease [Candidatus Avimonas sp.]HQD38403.1 carbohydrate ABC transporter permease [Candidatus Avimonas sp.]
MNTLVLRNEARKLTVSVIRAILVAGICFTILYPLLLKFAICFKSPEDLLDSSMAFLSRNPSFDTFKTAYQMMNYTESFLNTTLLCALSGLFHVISCTLVGYSLGRYKYKFKAIVFGFVIMTMIVPPQVISIPMYLSFGNVFGVSLIDNPVSLLLLYLTGNSLKSGLYIYLLTQFFRSLPKELEEAALVDGAGETKTMFFVMLPNARLMMITVFLFSFVWQWTDIFYTSMFFKNYELLSLNLGVVGSTYQQYMYTSKLPTHPMLISQMNNAGSVLFIVPLILIYLICNKYFVQGIERSGIVG